MNNLDKATPRDMQDSPNLAKSRRRFVRGVGVAVPVIMTVRAPSALACTCFAPSASASIALLHSRPDRDTPHCDGRTPGFWFNAWKTHPAIWAASGGQGKLFSDVFGSGYPGKTLKQVMGMTGSEDPYQLGAHLSAAYLNLRMGWVPSIEPYEVLSLQDLKDMWNGRNGSYSPTAGVTWGAEQIVTYLKTTMPA